jgi:outer membrane protein with beta-barrel domain
MPRAWRVLPVVCALVAFGVRAGEAQADSSARGQRRSRPAVGALAGYSRSDLVGPEAEQLRSRQGSVTGVFLLAPIARPLSFRPELLFSLKGGRTQTGSALLDIELAYLEMPLLARFSFSRGRFRPLLFGGPAPALQIGCDVQFIAGDQASRSTCGEGDFALFRTFDIGMVAGGGLEMRWPQSSLALEARYTAGLRSILDEAEVRNRAFGLVLALTF